MEAVGLIMFCEWCEIECCVGGWRCVKVKRGGWVLGVCSLKWGKFNLMFIVIDDSCRW